MAAQSSVSIPCPACKTKAKVPVNKISEKGIIYTCPNCKTKIRAAREGRKVSARKANDDELTALEPPPPKKKKAKKAKAGAGEPPAWVVTFADLATLLLTFFVLILSFSNMDVVKYRDLVGSVQTRFGVSDLTKGNYQAVSKGDLLDVDSNILKSNPNAAREKLVDMVHDAVAREGFQGAASISSTKEGVRVRMKGRVLFKPGGSSLNKEKKLTNFLKSVVTLLKNNKSLFLTVEGHTDNSKIKTAKYPSNWELSSLRASAVLAYLLEAGAPPEKLAAAGFADARPLFSNDRKETRILNRRVEFLFKLG